MQTFIRKMRQLNTIIGFVGFIGFIGFIAIIILFFDHLWTFQKKLKACFESERNDSITTRTTID